MAEMQLARGSDSLTLKSSSNAGVQLTKLLKVFNLSH